MSLFLGGLALCFVVKPSQFEHLGQGAMNIRQVRAKACRLVKPFGGLHQVSTVGQGGSQIIMVAGVLRIQPQGFFILLNGFSKLAAVRQGVTEIDVRFGKIRPQLDGSPELRHGLIELPR